MDNTVKNHLVRPFSIVFIVLSLIVFGLVFRPIWTSFEEESQDQAHTRAEGLAYQIVQIHSNFESKGGLRMPSSVSDSSVLAEGSIGKDPWGKPYFYRVEKVQGGAKSGVVVVWSEKMQGQVKLPF